ncbi:flippase [Flammeovirga sp. MY04]|uniref:flippase n=1 Tax=Flammeovirga sp. MY04 TaxID=1191459 RepID=UPI00080609C7|nr:flippase [Flammeovirga sp. MY04]ANQ48284.1 flippase [Flammeovirga sp. MY04]
MVSSIYQKFNNWIKKDGVYSILKNINWLFFDRILRMLGGLLINAWVSRYLGAYNMGIWDISLSVSNLFIVFSAFGFERLLIKNLVDVDDNTRNQHLSVAFTVRLIVSLVAFLLSGIILQLLAEGNSTRIMIGWLISSSIFLSVFDVITTKFQADLLSKYIVIAKGTGFIIGSLLKVYFILENYPLEYFVGSFLIELVIGFIILMYIYLKKYNHHQYKFTKKVFLEYWSTFFPLLISSLAYIIYTKVDQIMIDRLLDETAVGIYTRAVKLSDISVAIYAIIANSLFPELTKQFQQGIKQLHHSFERLSSMLTGVAYVGVIFVLISSHFVINLLYGEEYLGAISNLNILILGSIALYNGGMRGNYLILRNQKKIILITSFLSIFINAALNYVLIPIYSTNGAAIASVITLFSTNIFINLLFKETRTIGKLQLRSLFLYYFIKKSLKK